MKFRVKTILTALAAVLIAALFLHLPGFNGSRYHHWEWRRLPVAPLCGWMLLASGPFAAAQAFHAAGRRRTALALLSVAFASFAVFATAAQERPIGFDRVARVVENKYATSYLTDAQRLIDAHCPAGKALRIYPSLMPNFYVHGREKPPGPVMFYTGLLHLFGAGGAAGGGVRRAAWAGTAIITLVAAAGTTATYLLGRTLLEDEAASFAAASLLALCPGATVFYPMFDACYATLAAALGICWVCHLRRGGLGYAIAFGVVLTLATFMAYNLLVLGAWLAGLTAWELWRGRTTARRVGAGAAITAGAVSLFYCALWVLAGFDPFATFARAVRLQHAFDERNHRFWPWTMPTDFLDFALGTGYLVVPLAALALARRPRTALERAQREANLIGIGQIVLVGLTGLLRCETTRVWAMMFPLALLPAGLEASRLGWRGRAALYGLMWAVLVTADSNMSFIFA